MAFADYANLAIAAHKHLHLTPDSINTKLIPYDDASHVSLAPEDNSNVSCGPTHVAAFCALRLQSVIFEKLDAERILASNSLSNTLVIR